MYVLQGQSQHSEARQAVSDATKDWALGTGSLDLLFVFCSTKQDPALVAKILAEKFPGVPTVGCTTAGEHIADRHLTGGLVLTGIRTPTIRWSTAIARNLSDGFSEEDARAVTDRLISQLGVCRDDLDPSKHFCLVFIDGLSRREELVSARIADALEGIPLVGGSAGDDLRFARTDVIHGAEAATSAAVFALGESTTAFEILKHQHYTTTPKSLVITRADVASRRVYEMDGYPAIEAYARVLGLEPTQLTPNVTFSNPLTFVCDHKIYVRSIQRIETDGSLVFYCGIEEGMVLSVGGHESMDVALERDLGKWREAAAKGRPIELFLAFNCILRALEANQEDRHAQLGKILKATSKNVIGFDTYGEQLSGLHINQTLVGIAFFDDDRTAP